MKERTKITKASLLSIGAVAVTDSKLCFYIKDTTIILNVSIRDKQSIVIIELEQAWDLLPRRFDYIDEITTLLNGLTGLTSFHVS
jgi:hypothetical protein